jgi:hypothetical protein
MAGNCWGGIRHHFLDWTFVPTGENTWDVEVTDVSAGGLSGTLEAVQEGVRLIVTGTLSSNNGAIQRTYDAQDLIATTTYLNGSIAIFTAAATWCQEFGPLSGTKLPSSLLAGGDVELYRGTWRRSPDDAPRAVFLERDAGDRCALLFDDDLLDERGRAPRTVRTPTFPLDLDGVFSAHFVDRETGREYAVLGRLDPEPGLVSGEIHALRAGDGSLLWSGEMTAYRVRERGAGR